MNIKSKIVLIPGIICAVIVIGPFTTALIGIFTMRFVFLIDSKVNPRHIDKEPSVYMSYTPNSGTHNFNGTKTFFKDEGKITAEDGTKLTIKLQKTNESDSNEKIEHERVCIGVFRQNETEPLCYCIINYRDLRNNYNDFSKNINTDFMNIERKSVNGIIHAYKFTWGILYTCNNGSTYKIVPVNAYEKAVSESEVFKSIYSSPNNLGLDIDDIKNETLIGTGK